MSDEVEFLMMLLKDLGWTDDEIDAMSLEDAINLVELNEDLNP